MRCWCGVCPRWRCLRRIWEEAWLTALRAKVSGSGGNVRNGRFETFVGQGTRAGEERRVVIVLAG
jgi:hypothetical protein